MRVVRLVRRGICGTFIPPCCALLRLNISFGRQNDSLASPAFWCDILLTLAILGLLPATRKAVRT